MSCLKLSKDSQLTGQCLPQPRHCIPTALLLGGTMQVFHKSWMLGARLAARLMPVKHLA